MSFDISRLLVPMGAETDKTSEVMSLFLEVKLDFDRGSARHNRCCVLDSVGHLKVHEMDLPHDV